MEAKAMRIALVFSKARQFATEVKSSNMAHKIPEDIIDWLKDDEIRPFFDRLWQLGLVQRASDMRWERK